MQYHFFQIPVQQGENAALNRLLASASVSQVKQEFVADGERSFWAVCVCVLGAAPAVQSAGARPSRREQVDYREVLSPEHFARYAALRELRKVVAAEEGKPLYAIFTNEQMAAMAQLSSVDLAEIARIEGVGEKRVAEYGQRFVDCLGAAGGAHATA